MLPVLAGNLPPAASIMLDYRYGVLHGALPFGKDPAADAARRAEAEEGHTFGSVAPPGRVVYEYPWWVRRT